MRTRIRRVNPVQLTALIRAAATDVLTGHGVDTATLRTIDWTAPIARPKDPARGEYATSVALRAGSALDLPARALAADLAAALSGRDEIASAEVAGAGFVNLRLAAAARGELIGEVLAAGDGYGRPDRHVVHHVVDDDAYETLAERVGPDVARYALLRSTRPEPGVLARRVEENPAFLVRFAHARMCALARWARELGVTGGEEYGLLTGPAETALIGTLGEFEAVARCEPDRVTRYLERLAVAVGEFERTCPVLPMGDAPATERHRARLALAKAARQVLRNGLDLLGVDAPERM